VLGALAYIGSDYDAYLMAAEKIIINAGRIISSVEPRAGAKLTEFGRVSFNEVDEAAVDEIVRRRGVSVPLPHVNDVEGSIYEQFRSGHYKGNEIRDWLLGREH
jgi:hypothetical protein